MPGPSDEEPELTRRPWGKISAVVLAIVLALSVAALLARHPNRPPTVIQTSWSPAAPSVLGDVTFTAQATDPDGDDLTFTWDFGDGTSGQSPHAYSMSGTFIAYVVATDAKGGVATSESNLLRVNVSVPAPSPCLALPCRPGPAVPVLDADHWSAAPGTPITFFGNLSYAYLFTWNNESDHTKGGTYSRDIAWQNATLFDRFVFDWGDGSANTTGTSDSVGNDTTHVFASVGTFVVRLTVTQTDQTLIATRNGTAGFTVRIGLPPTASSTGASPLITMSLPVQRTSLAVSRP